MNLYRMMLEEKTRKPCLVSEKEFTDKVIFDNPDTIVDLIEKVFGASLLPEEYIWMVTLNTKHMPEGIFEISHGTVGMSLVSPREVFTRALLAGATKIVLVHNHPSGDPSPSHYDFEVTKEVKKAGDILGVKLVDHLIVGNHTYYSFHENSDIKL